MNSLVVYFVKSNSLLGFFMLRADVESGQAELESNCFEGPGSILVSSSGSILAHPHVVSTEQKLLLAKSCTALSMARLLTTFTIRR